jgi:hypothetical protein
MRVNEIKDAIENIRAILAAGGAASAERDLAKLIELLSAEGNRDLDEYIAEVKATLLQSTSLDIAAWVQRLKTAGVDEKAFKAALAEIANSDTIKRPEALEIAKGYGVIRINAKSKASIVESIEKHFYWTLYQRDANALAKRATPW